MALSWDETQRRHTEIVRELTGDNPGALTIDIARQAVDRLAALDPDPEVLGDVRSGVQELEALG